MPVRPQEVTRFLSTLKHPLKKEVAELRALILSADKDITEHIKWNAPSFCFRGEDRITFTLNKPDRIQLVFHRGAKVKRATGFVFVDKSGLIEWKTQDRGVVTFLDAKGIAQKKTTFIALVRHWMKETA